MFKSSIPKTTLLASLLFCLVGHHGLAGVVNKSIVADLISEGTSALSTEIPNAQALKMALHITSTDLRTFIRDNALVNFSQANEKRATPLRNEAKGFRALSLSEDGNTVVFSPITDEEYAKNLYMASVGDNGKPSEPVLLYTHERYYPVGYIQESRVSSQGNVIVWKEKVLGGHRILLIDQRVNMEPKVMFEGRNISDNIKISDDENHLFFFTFQSQDGKLRDFSSYAHFNGEWSEPAPVEINGEIAHLLVNGMSRNAGRVWIGNYITTRDGQAFNVVDELEINEDKYYFASQMSHQGDVAAYIEVDHKPNFRLAVRDMSPENHYRLTVVRFDEQTTEQAKNVIIEADAPTPYRLSENGEEIIWQN